MTYQFLPLNADIKDML